MNLSLVILHLKFNGVNQNMRKEDCLKRQVWSVIYSKENQLIQHSILPTMYLCNLPLFKTVGQYSATIFLNFPHLLWKN